MSDEPVEVIAIGAHPDDVKLGIGGTLSKLAKNRIRTAVAALLSYRSSNLGEIIGT